MNYLIKNQRILYFICLSFLLTVSCEDEEENETLNPNVPALQVIEDAVFGNVLVDQNNQVLYFSANDIFGESACIGGCEDVWPPLIASVFDLDLGAGIDSKDVSFTERADGTTQITYKGWPLYYFSPDGNGILEDAGKITGDGRGDVFYVAKPDYSLFLGKQTVEEGADPVLYLVDKDGVSLYLNTGDEEDISNCTGGCASVWPPFVTNAFLIVPSILKSSDFDVVYRDDEFGPQLSYLGNPLYYFSNDELLRGNVLGQGGGPAQSFFVIDPR